MNKSISLEDLAKMEKRFEADRANRVAQAAVSTSGVNQSAKNPLIFREDFHQFSVNLEQGEITNQKSSGRCWMFAALNTMRVEIMHKLNLDTFELSQNYTLFYDKLEKANYFLESILETLEEPVGSRLLNHLLMAPLQDGGQWDMMVSLIEKYGVVPKAVMPETVSSSATGPITSVMTEKLREYACQLREAHEKGAGKPKLRAMKREMMETIYRMLCIALGTPPKTFDLEVRDKEKNFIRDTKLTPQKFYQKYVGMKLADYVSLISAPTADKPYYRSFGIKFLGNVLEGREIRYVNLPIEELKAAAIAQLKDGKPVWFGCDVGKSSDRESGLMALGLFNREDLFHTTFTMNKAQRLDYGHSFMTHAMVLQGVNLDEKGKPNRWKVENSWGKDAGKDGYYVMTDDWFSEYTYQIVVNKKYLSKKILNAYKMDPIMLEPWDPMGSLA